MDRRGALVALAGLAVPGCVSSGEGGDSSGGEDGETVTDDGVETVADETLFTDTDYPVDVATGDEFRFQADVVNGGPVVLAVSSKAAGEVVFKETVETDADVTYTAEHDGVHRIQVVNVDEVDVLVTIRRA